MAGYLETESRSGSLYYIPPERFTNPDVPASYFRPRASRPHILRIAHASPETLTSSTPVLEPPKKRRKFCCVNKLAGSKDNALRFLRHISSITLSSDSTKSKGISTGIESHRFSGISTAPSSITDMSSGIGDRTGHSRTQSISGGSASGTGRRPGLTENIRTASNDSTQMPTNNAIYPGAISNEKPVAAGNGLAISIALAEPVLFLQGFDMTDDSSRTTSMLRGSLHLRVSKSAKIKAVSLKFRGRAETEWPEGLYQ